MLAARRWSFAAAFLGSLCCLVAPRSARAQAVGYQLSRYEPTPAGDPFLIVEYPWYASTRWFAGGLTLDYAHNLLVAETRDASGNVIGESSPIAHHSGGHLDLAGSFHDRFAMTLSVPVVLDQGGSAFAGIGPSGTTAGDPRLGVRARLHGQPDSSLSISAAMYLWLPVGVEDRFAGDSSARGMGRITVGGLARDDLRWAVNGSFLARKAATLTTGFSPAGNTVGNEVQLSSAVSYLGLHPRLALGPEALLTLAVAGEIPEAQSIATMELFGTARYRVTDPLQLGLGIGGVLAGSGVPDARIMFSIAYVPARKRSSSFESVVVLPDEDGHVGGVVVDDGKTKTVLDKPYASTEVSKRDGGKARAVQSTPTAVAQRTNKLAKALPPVDRDRDGIVDASDGCPERAGLASSDPIRHGCPASIEKVIVLPDADGHVGAVEVDDGTTKILVDKPYASAEVGADGKVQAIPPAPSRAVDRTIAGVSQTLPAADVDGDGFVDHEDACPDRAGVAAVDSIRRGCPAAAERVIVLPDADGHVGSIEVDDGRTKTVVDKAYAAVEVTRDGVVTAVPPTAARSIERAIASVARSLPIADDDKDGIRDEHDACPGRGGPVSTDPLRHGCPLAVEKVVVLPDENGHVGGVEIDDGKRKVVLDSAYATAEVVNGQVKKAPASPTPVIARATAEMSRSLPLQDKDDDGIVDRDDACSDRAGPASAQPTRHGCPKSVERVIVLADENGHVGAVEIDDGTTKTVVDKEYAAAEIGTDGRLRTLPAEPADVSLKFAAAMAARPPGARIILYFTARSEPVRDLTGPIDNLVAELKTKATYSIEVIGHTDQTGSERANVRIGLERAKLIADRLIAAGIPADRVRSTSMGSREPAVKRKSRRIVELSNRRVEIWLR